MIKFERKKIGNKPFYYLTEQVKFGNRFKKIQVYIGKNIPKNVLPYFWELSEKEKERTREYLHTVQTNKKEYLVLEYSRIDWKYYNASRTEHQRIQMMRDFAIKFIFESNAIEGSKLSEDEVSAIVKKRYVKKGLEKTEIIEAQNAMSAFELIQSRSFTLNQKNIKKLHEIVTNGLGIPKGYKERDIVVNNKKTTPPSEVRSNLQNLIKWYHVNAKKEHAFERAVLFHNRFEAIHPFEDGNGRVGRLLLNWMLLKNGFGPILIRNRNKKAYFSVLDKGDNGLHKHPIRFMNRAYRQTIKELVSEI